jgi:MHS family proline/betaine transporter-like MFS transporter
MPTYAIRQLGLPASTGFAATLATGVVLTVLTPFVGHWSDSAGRVRIMAVAALLMLCTVYPTFAWLNHHATFGTMLIAMIWIGGLKSAYFGALPALMSEIFPTQTRATGLSVSYNVGVTVFGGFAPFVITWLIDATGDKLAPGFYLMFCSVLSLIALYSVRSVLKIR